jgi:two-component system chemotaxis sensor kinase CheA
VTIAESSVRLDPEYAELLRIFVAESEEGLQAMEQALLALETQPGDPELLSTIFRVAHTLKGNAGALGLGELATVTHAVEDVLEQMRGGALRAGRDEIGALLEALDALRALVPMAGSGERASFAHEPLVERLRALGSRGAAAPAANEPVAAEKPGAAAGTKARTLRIPVETLDRILDLTGEITVARGRLRQALESGRGAAFEQALEIEQEADRSFLDLQELILRARMVPVGPAFRAYARSVRDLAAGLRKQARLVVEGEDVEVDTSVIAHLRDPLTHMVRNAVDHGIEAPALRKARGKDACGTLWLRAFRDAGNIVVELQDDGAGLDLARIAERGRAIGLIAPGAQPADAELRRLIFEPGFTTSERVTDVSGRGVGMDVVRRNVEALRGSISVSGDAGSGTRFTIRLPLTLAIIDGFGVAVGEESYVIPLDAVAECLELDVDAKDAQAPTGVVELRGRAVPYLRLRRHFGVPGQPQRENVVVVRYEGGEVGLAVDALLGERQTVIKPLGSLFRALPWIAGSAIQGDGRLALILDVPALLRSALEGAEVNA